MLALLAGCFLAWAQLHAGILTNNASAHSHARLSFSRNRENGVLACFCSCLFFCLYFPLYLILEYCAAFDQKNDSHLLYYLGAYLLAFVFFYLFFLTRGSFLTCVLGKLLYLCRRLYMYLRRWCVHILSIILVVSLTGTVRADRCERFVG